MGKHERFNFKLLADLETKCQQLQLDIQFQEDLSPLATPLDVGEFHIPNCLVIHPMEGCDGTLNGNPSELTKRRYIRFGSSGAGIIWFEATAIQADARANARQLWLSEDNKVFF